ncbi:Poly [ADP-ribose] polymerase 2 [Boothiomyces macroporosus]|uniref:Poly [ADP-ribose] polymerase n=1 Tax=Boothiomyces macroporosus TaxID=261099 RepID=A0AAD5UBF9_9FUNG|nr:Poly [ADP-ribose] polymerase 2 [Boothiomyces macroporosus]
MRRSSRNANNNTSNVDSGNSDPQLFESKVFVLSNSVAKSDLKSSISSHGGKVLTSLSAKAELVDPVQAKIKNAFQKSIPVVSTDFINDSIKDKVLVDDSKHLLTDKDVSSTDVDMDGSDPEENEENQPPKKKAKTEEKKDKDAEPEDKEKKDKDDEPEDKEKIVKVIKKGSAIVDHLCPGGYQMHVYEDNANVYDVMLNQTDIKNNNNKFYVLQLLQNDTSGAVYVWTRWGRVGVDGQNKLELCPSLPSAIATFQKKFHDKTKNHWDNRANFVKYPGKYFLIERDFEEEVEPDPAEETVKVEKKIPDSKLEKPVKDLIDLIFNTKMMEQQMMEIGYDAKKMPLGKLSKAHIQKGYNVLTKIGEVLRENSKNKHSKLQDLSSEFYTIIPHSFGFSVPPVINSDDALARKIEMVEALADIEIATTLLKNMDKEVTEHPSDRNYHSLKRDLKPIDKKSKTFNILKKYTQNTHGKTHNAYKLEILDAFELHRDEEAEKFNNVGKEYHSNKMLLWHGSRLTNFVGILSQGLRIAPPEAPVTGYMFGKGVYFADMVSKSANYCCTSRQSNTGILLLCEVALGKHNELYSADYNAGDRLKAVNAHSTKGLGRTVPDPKEFVELDGVTVPCGKGIDAKLDQSYLQYNEYIVYDVSQIKIK